MTGDLRICDGCHRETLETEQGTCITSHVDEGDFIFLRRPCPCDYFYCPQCLNKYSFCDGCSERASVENQKILFENENKKKF